MIEVSHISKSFRGKKALDDVSLSVGRQETVCIIGLMGSGKSTLLRCIAGLEFPESGSVRIDGRLMDQKNVCGYNHIGMVFQNFNLFPHLNYFTILCWHRSRSWASQRRLLRSRQSGNWKRWAWERRLGCFRMNFQQDKGSV